jgi:HAD superfamily hydrolase (TIGR01549 family)
MADLAHTPSAIFFDVGNTLSHVNYPVIASILHEAGAARSADEVRSAEIRSRVKMDRFLQGRQSMEGASMFRTYCEMVLEDLGLGGFAGFEAVVDRLHDYDRAGNLWDLPESSVPEVVRRVRERGLRTAVVSNSDGRVAEMLERQGVAALFDAIVDSGRVKVEKPDPAIFLHAARQVGVEPERTVHVGDLYSIDVVGCRRAGMRGILLDPLGAWAGYECEKARDLAEAARIVLSETRLG